jgi:hypothetical protein
MIKALLLIFDPAGTWDGIMRTRRSLVFILFTFLCPFLLFVCAVEGYGLVHLGKTRGFGGRAHLFTTGEAVIIEAAQFLVSIALVFLGAQLVKSIGETFHGRHTLTQSFAAVAYGLGPLFLLRLGDAFSPDPVWIPWVTFSVGMLFTIAVLYHGVPRMMEPDPSHAFGLFLMSSLLLLLIMGLFRFVMSWYLQGKFTALEASVSSLAARLPF